VGVWDSHNRLDNQPKLYYCEGSPENPANWHIDTEFSSILGSSGPFSSIDSFAVYDDTMYLSSGKKLYSFNGTDWSIAKSYDDVYAFLDMQVYDDKLYAGTANKIYAYNGTSWEASFNATEGAYYAISMITYDGKIYVGMGNGYIFADPAPLKAEHETIVVPEFSSTTILAVFTAVTMLAAALTKKNPTKRLD